MTQVVVLSLLALVTLTGITVIVALVLYTLKKKSIPVPKSSERTLASRVADEDLEEIVSIRHHLQRERDRLQLERTRLEEESRRLAIRVRTGSEALNLSLQSGIQGAQRLADAISRSTPSFQDMVQILGQSRVLDATEDASIASAFGVSANSRGAVGATGATGPSGSPSSTGLIGAPTNSKGDSGSSVPTPAPPPVQRKSRYERDPVI